MPQQRVVEMIAAARTRVDAIRAAPARGGRHRLVDESLLDDLAAVFDALATTEDDLRQQGDRLAAARGALEGRFHRYQDLFDLMPDGYLVTDPSGVIEDANKLAIALLAHTRTVATSSRRVPGPAVARPSRSACRCTAQSRSASGATSAARRSRRRPAGTRSRASGRW